MASTRTYSHKWQLALLSGTLIIAACSDPAPDVRVTLCQDLASDLTTTTEQTRWREPKSNMNGYEDLQIIIQSDASAKSPAQIVCYYKRLANEEDSARTIADPYSVYETYPHRVVFNGNTLSGKSVLDRVNEVMRKQGKALVENVKKGVQSTSDFIKDKLKQE